MSWRLLSWDFLFIVNSLFFTKYCFETYEEGFATWRVCIMLLEVFAIPISLINILNEQKVLEDQRSFREKRKKNFP